MRSVLLSVTRPQIGQYWQTTGNWAAGRQHLFFWSNLLLLRYRTVEVSLRKKFSWWWYQVDMSACIFSFRAINSLFGDEITVKLSDICRCFWHKCYFNTLTWLQKRNLVKKIFMQLSLVDIPNWWGTTVEEIHLKATVIDWSLRCCHCGKTVWSKNKQTETMSSYPTYPTHQTRPVHLSLTLSVAKFKHCIAMQFNALETSDRGNCCL